eukprot:g27702.t1
MLGLSLGFGLLLMTLGAMAPLLLLLQLLLLGLEVLLRKLTPRWKQEAMHLREQREAMSAAALAMEMGFGGLCARGSCLALAVARVWHVPLGLLSSSSCLQDDRAAIAASAASLAYQDTTGERVSGARA